MKKKICVALAIMATLSLAGCQATTRKWGGSTTIELDPNLKLEEITWKDDSLWYLTTSLGCSPDNSILDYKFYLDGCKHL